MPLIGSSSLFAMQRNVKQFTFVTEIQHRSENRTEEILLLCYTALQICVLSPTWITKSIPQIIMEWRYESNCLVSHKLQMITVSSPVRGL